MMIMKKRIANLCLEFFQDQNGDGSMTRLCTFILVVSGVVQIFVYPDHYTAGIEMIIIGLGGKITQKKLSESK